MMSEFVSKSIGFDTAFLQILWPLFSICWRFVNGGPFVTGTALALSPQTYQKGRAVALQRSTLLTQGCGAAQLEQQISSILSHHEDLPSILMSLFPRLTGRPRNSRCLAWLWTPAARIG
jgi:hypothetical protein